MIIDPVGDASNLASWHFKTAAAERQHLGAAGAAPQNAVAETIRSFCVIQASQQFLARDVADHGQVPAAHLHFVLAGAYRKRAGVPRIPQIRRNGGTLAGKYGQQPRKFALNYQRAAAFARKRGVLANVSADSEKIHIIPIKSAS